MARATKSLNPDTIKNGFRAGGLHPLNRANVNDSRLLGQRRTAPQVDPAPVTLRESQVVQIVNESHSASHKNIEEISPAPYTSTRSSDDLLKEIRFLTERYKGNLADDDMESKLYCTIIQQQLTLLESKSPFSSPAQLTEISPVQPTEISPVSLSISDILTPPPPNVRAGRKRRFKISNTNGVMSTPEIIEEYEENDNEQRKKEEGVQERKRIRLEKQLKKALEPKKKRGRPPKAPKPPTPTPSLNELDSSSDDD